MQTAHFLETPSKSVQKSFRRANRRAISNFHIIHALAKPNFQYNLLPPKTCDTIPGKKRMKDQQRPPIASHSHANISPTSEHPFLCICVADSIYIHLVYHDGVRPDKALRTDRKHIIASFEYLYFEMVTLCRECTDDNRTRKTQRQPIAHALTSGHSKQAKCLEISRLIGWSVICCQGSTVKNAFFIINACVWTLII